MAGFLVDTNVLIYSYDQTQGAKRNQAINVLGALVAQRSGVLSTQVLGEFFVTATRKIPTPLSYEEAAHTIANYVESWIVCDVTSPIISEAVRGVGTHNLPYYDSLIWATARLNQVSTIITEDGQHGRLIEGVRYLNPFHAEFDLRAIIPGMH